MSLEEDIADKMELLKYATSLTGDIAATTKNGNIIVLRF
jgi:hypothetical protein